MKSLKEYIREQLLLEYDCPAATFSILKQLPESFELDYDDC